MNYKIREYRKEDAFSLQQLFINTVNEVNRKHYDEQQRRVWIENSLNIEQWENSFNDKIALVYELEEKIVGFIDATEEGYIDRLYVHSNYQNMKIASRLLNVIQSQLIDNNIMEFTVHASITAKSFFLKQGYYEVRENEVIRNNVSLINYEMKKEVSR